jgi:hypothetical protein
MRSPRPWVVDLISLPRTTEGRVSTDRLPSGRGVDAPACRFLMAYSTVNPARIPSE